MAFKLPISEELRQRIDAEHREMERLFALPDRWLAAELLRLVRDIRGRTKYAARSADTDTYNSVLLWDVIPELARRLGATLELNESTDYSITRLEGEMFRDFVASCLGNVSTSYMAQAKTGRLLEPVSVLFHSVPNGNPVAMALDRLVPPSPDCLDRLSQEIRSVSLARGLDGQSSWTPEMQHYPRAQLRSAMR